MAMTSPKRGSSVTDGETNGDLASKRPRASSSTLSTTRVGAVDSMEPPLAKLPSPAEEANYLLQRSIALVLKQVGFDSSSPQALESFSAHVEEYMQAVIEDLKRISLAARRDQPNPVDYELTLHRFNLPIRSLKPHLRHPLSDKDTAPKLGAPAPQGEEDRIIDDLPILSDDLSGTAVKHSLSCIPDSFPDFPSIHTFRSTMEHTDTTRDLKEMRENAARESKQGEDALRRLVRAAKLRKQKEIRSLVDRDAITRERYRLWESAMEKIMDPSAGQHTQDNREAREVASHSMIVNFASTYTRGEVQRSGRRQAPIHTTTVIEDTTSR